MCACACMDVYIKKCVCILFFLYIYVYIYGLKLEDYSIFPKTRIHMFSFKKITANDSHPRCVQSMCVGGVCACTGFHC